MPNLIKTTLGYPGVVGHYTFFVFSSVTKKKKDLYRFLTGGFRTIKVEPPIADEILKEKNCLSSLPFRENKLECFRNICDIRPEPILEGQA